MFFLVCVLSLKKSAALALHVKNQRLQNAKKNPANPIKNLPEDSKFSTLIFQDYCQIATAVVICLHALIAIRVGWKQ